jgi:hypothetical protein
VLVEMLAQLDDMRDGYCCNLEVAIAELLYLHCQAIFEQMKAFLGFWERQTAGNYDEAATHQNLSAGSET